MLHMRIDNHQVVFADIKRIVLHQKAPSPPKNVNEFRKMMGMHGTVPVPLIFGGCDIQQFGGRSVVARRFHRIQSVAHK